ncbi:MAG: glycosyltransferase [Verrucomicrobia bacterium]|nr:MAG: glycosyltransferase [Verrucomicrobiota bacterium]
MGRLKISIVIPAFNEERLLGETLREVARATGALAERGCEHELIVCDNNSTDRTAEIARAAGARVVFEPINQIGRARNSGAAAASGDWLLFIDADSHPSAELFRAMLTEIQTGRCLAGGSVLKLDVGDFVANFITAIWNLVSRYKRWVAGSFIFVETAAFRSLGGFSHEFFAGEELDLSRRLIQLAKERGREIVILHRHPLRTSARKVKLYSGREHLRFMLKAFLNHKRTIRDRTACYQWYDGRR